MAQDFDQLLQACSELSSFFPEGMVFIGGIAVYAHAINNQETEGLAETTHDGDLYISKADLIDLRDIEQLTNNRRLGKQQLVKKGFEFDVYVQRESDLCVPYEEVIAHSTTYDLLRVASLEHLLVLKLAAYLDRKGSEKGNKDARDILRIATLLVAREEPVRPEQVLLYWGDQEIAELKAIGKGPAPVTLARGNVHEARAFRRNMEGLVKSLEAWDNTPKTSASPRPR
jgi:hypothetical protein